MHQTAYRRDFVERGRHHAVRPMAVTPHLSAIKEDALRYKADAPGHNEPWSGEYCGGISHLGALWFSAVSGTSPRTLKPRLNRW